MKTTRFFYRWFAPLYDPITNMVESRDFFKWRQLLWSKVEGNRILEVGVGTGRSFPFYPSGASIIAVDLSETMLKQAQEKSRNSNLQVKLERMDVQRLIFEDASFETVVSSLVFCEVRDPVGGLIEVKRVVRNGGKVVMLEHVVSDNQKLAWFMNLFNPVLAFLTGENINRDTIHNVEKSGLIVERVTHLSSIFKLIEARRKE